MQNSGSFATRAVVKNRAATRRFVRAVLPPSRSLAALALAGLVLLSAAADAAPPAVVLLVDRDIGEALSQAVGGFASEMRRIETGAAALDTACAAASGATPRLALIPGTPSPSDIETCRRGAEAEVISIGLGHQAIALVAPANAAARPVASASLFRTLSRHAGQPGRPAAWNDLDPQYPKLPIGLLLPPPDSTAKRLFDQRVMAPACTSAAPDRLPFDIGNRVRYCALLRNDLPAVQRQGGVPDVARWAASAADGQIAIVTLAELRQLDRVVVPLPLDGVLPTVANIESGRYAAAEKVEVVVVVPRRAEPARRTEASHLALDLLAEANSGPAGALPAAGLIPLPPADRVAARARAVSFLGAP